MYESNIIQLWVIYKYYNKIVVRINDLKYLEAEYSVKTKNLNVEIRVSFVNVKCFFDFECECRICSVDDFRQW